MRYNFSHYKRGIVLLLSLKNAVPNLLVTSRQRTVPRRV